jgi:hypothetical protein
MKAAAQRTAPDLEWFFSELTEVAENRLLLKGSNLLLATHTPKNHIGTFL